MTTAHSEDTVCYYQGSTAATATRVAFRLESSFSNADCKLQSNTGYNSTIRPFLYFWIDDTDSTGSGNGDGDLGDGNGGAQSSANHVDPFRFGDGQEAQDTNNWMNQRFEIWAEGTYTTFESEPNKGHFGILHLGADYLLNEHMLIGVGSQIDWIDSRSADGTSSSDGRGFLVGPFATARLAPNAYLDLRAAWGRSYNTVSPFNIYSDDFEGERWFASGELIGEMNFDNLTIRPQAKLAWISEETQSYQDSLGVLIPSVTSETGTLEFGPHFATRMELGKSSPILPFASISGIWTFAQTNAGSTPSSLQANAVGEGLRARLEAGFELPAYHLSIAGRYDGIGEPDLESWSADMSVALPF